MSDDLNVLIGYQVQNTAEWRRGKAEQFPNDTRNLRAAEKLEELAAQLDTLEGSLIHRQIRKLSENLDPDAWVDVNETVSTELRSIGFYNNYPSAVSFLEWYRDCLREELDRAASVELDEQAENDPAVKAAKQAYDEAYAKAYAEAARNHRRPE